MRSLCGWLTLLVFPALAPALAADDPRGADLPARAARTVFRERVEPNWLPGGTSFWYRIETARDVWETVHVDMARGIRTPGYSPPFVAPRLQQGDEAPRASLDTGSETRITILNKRATPVRLAWLDTRGRRHPYGEIAPGQRHSQHTFAGHAWLVTDAQGRRLGVFVAGEEPADVVVDDTVEPSADPRAPGRAPRPAEGTSPDGRWRASVQEHNVVLTDTATRTSVRLTTDGRAEEPYRGPLLWSPDSRFLAAQRAPVVERRTITFVEALPAGEVQPRVHTVPYAKPGDPLPTPKVVVIEIATRQVRPVEDRLLQEPFTPDGRFDLEWRPDGSELVVEYNRRGHQAYRLVAVQPSTGVTRAIVEETSATFIDYTNKTWRHGLDATGELLWMSERSGWAHLYRVDVASGRIRNAVTSGEWVVRRVEHVDEARGQVWFMAGGVHPGQDPYHLHLCRADLDGRGFRVLTTGDGTHQVRFSPDRRWFLDTWSRVDQPPVTELRRAEDGALILELERADATALLAAGWTLPERFHAKGRDGATDIYGVLYRPSTLDPKASYPVVEEIYAGPHGAFVPKAFGRQWRQHQLAEQGFIVVQIDGMGTNFRSKAFHDVSWKNLGDAGFPDRIAWMKAAASTRPWMDLSRVGIYGGSAGGQNALRALLAFGDFYKAAAADCGCHDNRMDKIWWNEQWMGWPIGPHYAEQSNVTQAHRLRGKLLLTVGEVDENVDPASTLQVAAALVRADKDFELVILPSQGHGAGESAYGIRRRQDFFVRSLLGVEPRRP